MDRLKMLLSKYQLFMNILLIFILLSFNSIIFSGCFKESKPTFTTQESTIMSNSETELSTELPFESIAETTDETNTMYETESESVTESTVSDSIPIIYVNQVLIIPISGSVPISESKLVNQGILSSSSKQIALSFDAGWLYDQTISLLNVLDMYQVKSTFFLRGNWVKDHPDLAKEIINRGHSIENHSLTHSHMKNMSNEEIRYELEQTTSIIKNTTGYTSYLFRPPFGEYDSRMLSVLGELGYTYTVLWTVDSYDWAEELNGVLITKEYLVNRVLSKATANGIILMHVGGYNTVAALPEIITGLRNSGYNIVKINDMLPPASSTNNQVLYTVVDGDTLFGIAKKYGITVEDIIKANNFR